MSYWNLLDINPTSEISIIKKAYAKKLKIFHPEDDPKGFQLLREAYDSALKFAKNDQFHKTKYIIPKENINTFINNNIAIMDNHISETISTEQLIEEFFEKIHTLYNDFFSRINKNNWEKLLNDELMWNIDCKEIMNKKIIYFLMDHYHLPKDIWILLNDSFYWDNQQDYLYSYHSEKFIDYIFYQLSDKRNLRYSYFNENVTINYDEYLNYREEAFNALISNNFEKAKNYISLAYKIYQADPDLLCMEGEYYLGACIGSKARNSAKDMFKKAIFINPNDIDTYFYQAEIFFNRNFLVESIEICENIKYKVADNFQLFSLIGKCYFKMDNFYKANDIFLNNLKLKPNDIETKKYLYKIANIFQIKLKKRTFDLKLRYHLKKIYQALNEYRIKKEMKLSYKDYFKLFKSFVYLSLFIVTLISIILFFSNIYSPFFAILFFLLFFLSGLLVLI